MKRWLYFIYSRVRSKLYSVFAFWVITFVLFTLLYFIIVKKRFTPTLIISFCFLFATWLSIMLDFLQKSKNLPEDVRDLAKNFKRDYNVAKRCVQSTFYESPFFIIIGEPAAGKTTLVKSSQLTKFSASQRDDEKGRGGTQGCDWFFRREAFLLDTQGKMVTKSGVELWEEFLKNLKRVRPRYPINGVIVVVPVDQLCDPIGYQEGQKENQQYDIYTTELTREQEKSLKEKAEDIKIRLQEIIRALNFNFPVYFVLSKCDLLKGFHNSFKKVLLEGIEEENKMLGMARFEDFELLSEELKRWQAAKATKGSEIKDSWRFIQNLRALKSRIFIYNQIMSDFTKNSYCAEINSQQREPYFRGYFFSSCRQYYVNDSDEWEENYDAYFTRDLFQEKLLKETSLAQPVKSAIDSQEPKRNWVKIGTIVTLVGILFGVVSYFWQNYKNFQNLQTYASEFVPKAKVTDLAQQHKHIMDKLVWYDKNLVDVNTKSFLIPISYERLELKVQESAIKYFYQKIVHAAFERFLLHLDDYFIDELARMKLKSNSQNPLEQFVNATNYITRMRLLYKKAKKDLTGFEEIYQKTFAEELKDVSDKLYQNKLIKQLERIKSLCDKSMDFEEVRKFKEKLMKSLASTEERAFIKLEMRILSRFENLFTGKRQTSYFLVETNELLKAQEEIAEIHNDLTRDFRWSNFEKKLKPAIFQFEVKYRFLQQKDYPGFYKVRMKRDVKRSRATLEKIKDEKLAVRLAAKYDRHDKRIVRSALKRFDRVELITTDRRVDFVTLYPKLYYLASRANVLARIKNQKQNYKDFSRLMEDINKFKRITSTQRQRFAEYVINYEDGFLSDYRDETESFIKGYLEKIYTDFQTKVNHCNEDYLAGKSRRKYRRKLRYGLRQLGKEIMLFASLAKNLDPNYWEEAQEDLKRIKLIDEEKKKPVDERDVVQEIMPFLEEIRNLNKAKRVELSQKIRNDELSEYDIRYIFQFTPKIYNNKEFKITNIPASNTYSPLTFFILLNLKNKMTKEFRASALKKIFFSYWIRTCKKFVNLDYHRSRTWEKKFKGVYLAGKNFSRLLKKFDDAKNTNQIEDHYRKLSKLIKEEMERLYSLKYITNHERIDIDNLKRFPKSHLSPECRKYHELLLEIDQDIIDLFQLDSAVIIDKEQKRASLEADLRKLDKHFTQYVKPWFLLRSKLENARLTTEDISELEDWIGKEVLSTLENFREFGKQVKRYRKRRLSKALDANQVLRNWHQDMQKDYKKWYKVSVDSLYKILTSTIARVKDKFPFKRRAEKELSLEEIDPFFKEFLILQKPVYRNSLIDDKRYGRTCKKIYEGYEQWQWLFYKGQNKSELEVIRIQVEVKKFPLLSRSTGIHYMKFGKIDDSDMTTKKPHRINWEMGEDLSVVLQIRGRERIMNVPITTPILGNWKFFRLVDKYYEKVRTSYITLGFPYKLPVSNRREPMKALVTIHIKNFKLPWPKY